MLVSDAVAANWLRPVLFLGILALRARPVSGGQHTGRPAQPDPREAEPNQDTPSLRSSATALSRNRRRSSEVDLRRTAENVG